MRLKPCPFCGCVAEDYDGDAVFRHDPQCWIVMAGITNFGEVWICSEQERKEWNTRIPDPLLTEAFEALRAIKMDCEVCYWGDVTDMTKTDLYDYAVKVLAKHKEGER